MLKNLMQEIFFVKYRAINSIMAAEKGPQGATRLLQIESVICSLAFKRIIGVVVRCHDKSVLLSP
jgi:hypothetical protein